MVHNDLQWLLNTAVGSVQPLTFWRDIHARHRGEERGQRDERFFPILSSSRLRHQGPRRDLIAHFISPQARDRGMGDFVKTNVEIKLHPKSSGPRFIASSQTGQSSTWSLFQNVETLLLPRFNPRRHPGVLPNSFALHTHAVAAS